MIKNITYRAFEELVQRRLSNDFKGSEFTVSFNEVMMYLYPAIAQVITAQANQYYAVEGIFPDLNSFNLTYKFPTSTLVKDEDTGDYYLSLPQVPVGLPEGVSIKSPTLIGFERKSFPLIYLAGYSRSYGLKMPTPNYGGYWYNEGSKLIIITEEDLINSGMKLSVTMLATRGKEESDTLNLTDDAFGNVFDIVISKLSQRISVPKDKINDGADKRTEQ